MHNFDADFLLKDLFRIKFIYNYNDINVAKNKVFYFPKMFL